MCGLDDNYDNNINNNGNDHSDNNDDNCVNSNVLAFESHYMYVYCFVPVNLG